MRLSRDAVVEALCRGEAVVGPPHEGRVVKIQLKEPRQWHLLRFILRNGSAPTHAEAFTAGLKASFVASDETEPPRSSTTPQKVTQWRLTRICASGFGGINAFGGPDFDLVVGGESLFLEGRNGVGKSSLIGALIWALTGLRSSSDRGLTDELSQAQPVHDDTEREVGVWPPIATYPPSLDQQHEPRVRVSIEFTNAEGDIAFARRELRGTTITEEIDPRLEVLRPLIEASVVLPNRLAQLRLSDKRGPLHEAVKSLTGLDDLALAGQTAAELCHRGRAFLKYAKERGVDAVRAAFESSVSQARNVLRLAGKELSLVTQLEDDSCLTVLDDAVEAMRVAAAERMQILSADVDESLDLSSTAGQKRVVDAVQQARVDLATSSSEDMRRLKDLAALSPDDEARIQGAVDEAESALADALMWHRRQLTDPRLRLRAAAARWHAEHRPTDPSVSECPVCEQDISIPAIAAQLTELLSASGAADSQLAERCVQIEHHLFGSIPPPLRDLRVLAALRPRRALAAAITQQYVEPANYRTVIRGMSVAASSFVDTRVSVLEEYEFATSETRDVPECARKLVVAMSDTREILRIASWWKARRSVYRDAWIALVGQRPDAHAPRGGVGLDPLSWTPDERWIRWRVWSRLRASGRSGSGGASRKSSRPARCTWCWTRERRCPRLPATST